MAEQDYIQIELTQGLITWISPEDRDIAGWGWYAKQAGSKEFPTYYAMYSSSAGGTKIEYYLHDLVWSRMMDTDVPYGFLVDHINRDKLDNRRTNLRLATKSQNEQNKTKRRANTTSKYKGVVKMGGGRKKCWRATLTIEGHNQHIGTFYSEDEAAIAYNQAAYEAFGEFAVLNDVNKAVPSREKMPDEELTWLKQQYNRNKKGRPRKNPHVLQRSLRGTGNPVGRPAVLPRTKEADKKARYREKLRERTRTNTSD